MKACLDPNVPVLSPSLEIRFLTGLALSATVLVLATGDGADISSEMIESSVPMTVEVMAPSFLDWVATKLLESEVLDTEGLDAVVDQIPLLGSSFVEFLESFGHILLNIIKAIGFFA
jgi:hypothetical protein